MNVMNYDRKALKRRAKEYIRDLQPRAWKVTLLYLLLASLIPNIITDLLPHPFQNAMMVLAADISQNPQGWLAQFQGPNGVDMLQHYQNLFNAGSGMSLITIFVTVLIGLYGVVMNYGYMNYALKLYKGEVTAYTNIFGGFPVAAKAIGASVMIAVYVFLWSLLAVFVWVCACLIAVVAAVAFELTGWAMVLLGLVMFALWVALVIFLLFVEFRYALAPYYILHNDMGVFEAIRASKNEMHGNIGRRFMLGLSFFGWLLLVALIDMAVVGLVYVLSAAIGGFEGRIVGTAVAPFVGALVVIPLLLWLDPYMSSAHAGFFLTVTGQDDGPAAPRSVPEYTPPQPSGIWDNVPPPPSFTAPAAEEEKAPAVPEPPTEPEAEPEPEATEPETVEPEMAKSETAEPEALAAPEPSAETETPAEPDLAEEEQGPATEE